MPVILKPCLFNNTPIAQFQALNAPSKPLEGLSEVEQEQIWLEVCTSIVKIFDTELIKEIKTAILNSNNVLDLSGKKLQSLPSEIGDLINLTELNLSNNSLASLPPDIGRLTNLTILSLSNNKLTSLPAEIGNLEKLIELFINQNNLTRFPNSFGNLKSLRTLDLSKNNLSFLPDEIRRLGNITRLILDYNNLSKVDEVIDLVNLKCLKISNNKIKILPDLGCLIHLDEIFLDSNEIEDLSLFVRGLEKAELYSLQGNDIKIIPSNIGMMDRMKNLFLSNNRITQLPPAIGQAKNLTKLYLRNNKLKSIPLELRLLSLEQLDLMGNPLPIKLENLEISKPNAIILGYINHLKAQEGYLENFYFNEAKIIIIGEENVGKTSIVRELLDSFVNDHLPEPLQSGVSIQYWPISIEEKFIQLKIWDFAGKKTTHAAHNIFFSKS